MKRIVYIAIAAMAICLMSTTSHAQSGNLKLVFHVPFAFTVENNEFPAGDYEVTQPDRLILMLRNEKTQASGFEHVTPAQSHKEANGRVRMVFHRYGNEYFLYEVTDGSIAASYDFRKGKEEKHVADTSPRPQLKVVSVLSDGIVRAGK